VIFWEPRDFKFIYIYFKVLAFFCFFEKKFEKIFEKKIFFEKNFLAAKKKKNMEVG